MNKLFLLHETDVIRWTLIPLCIQVILVSLECIYNGELYRPAHLLGWDRVRASRRIRSAGALRAGLLVFFFDYPNVLFLFAARAGLAVTVFWFAVQGRYYPWMILVLWVLGEAATRRNASSENGSDQMSNIILTSVGLYFLFSGSAFIRALSIFFIASQGMLSYLTAGFFKAIKMEWLNGLFLEELLHTRTFGNRMITNLCDRWSSSYKAGSIALICWEVIMGICFLLPPPVCLCVLAGGVLFHFSVAIVMGFNTFFWVFLAIYPSIYFVSLKIH